MADPLSYRPENIPTEPGVYRFRNPAGKIIYVGKAKNLRSRLSSYFQKNLPEKIGLNVLIKNNRRNKGTITFFYKDLDQLNKIIEIIKSNY